MYLSICRAIPFLIGGFIILIIFLLRLKKGKEKEKISLKEKTLKFNHGEQLFKSTLDDIKFEKNLQWKITNYSLLIYAALFYVLKNGLFNYLVLVLSIVVFIFGIYLVVKIQYNLRDHRIRLRKFSESLYLDAYYWMDPEKLSQNENFWRDSQIFSLLTGANIVGVSFFISLICYP